MSSGSRASVDTGRFQRRRELYWMAWLQTLGCEGGHPEGLCVLRVTGLATLPPERLVCVALPDRVMGMEVQMHRHRASEPSLSWWEGCFSEV